jgi:predicted phage tail protein
MKKLLMLAIISIFILSSCTKNNTNPVNTETIPTAPTQSSPIDASTGIAVLSNLTWNSGSGAVSYTLQVSANSSFSSFIYNQGGLTNTTQQMVGLNPLSIYYWKVDAANNAGTSSWSAVWSFTTAGPSPNAPLLLSPANGSTINSSPLSLSWIVSSGADSYTLQVSADSLFTSFAYNQSGLISSGQQVTGLTASTYYWRVAAVNNNGPSGWSQVWSIKTNAPTAPALSSPINGVTAQSTSPVLAWSASGGATSFILQVSLNSSFTSFVFNESGLTSLNQQVMALTALTKYYWRVGATNGYGTSGWSDTWYFTTP